MAEARRTCSTGIYADAGGARSPLARSRPFAGGGVSDMDRKDQLLEVIRAGRRPALLIAWFVLGAYGEPLTLPRTVPQGGTLRIRGPVSAVAARMGERRIRMFALVGGGTLGLMPVGALDKPGHTASSWSTGTRRRSRRRWCGS